MKTVILSVKERLGLGGLLNKKYQQRGLSLDTLSLSQKILDKIVMDEDERKKLKLKNENGRLTWDLKKDEGKSVEFNQDQIKFLNDIVKSFSDTNEFSLEDGFIVDLIDKLNAG